MKTLFVAYNDYIKHQWVVIGQLVHKEFDYIYSCTHGSKKVQSLSILPDFFRSSASNSKKLFPFFTNRILSPKRPEYDKFLRWLGLSKDHVDPLDMITRTGGLKATDTFEVFLCPTPENGQYKMTFLLHGVEYLYDTIKPILPQLQTAQDLKLMLDIQNDRDENAIAIRSEKPLCLLGYTPRYLVDDLQNLRQYIDVSKISTKLVQINEDAPPTYKFLCEISAPWPDGFQPCSGEEYQTVDSLE